MKEENGFWIDIKGNKWSTVYTDEKEAEKLSLTLVNCRYCENCKDCTNCKDCNDCRYCENCDNCKNCRYCVDCDNCKDCWYCVNCVNCDNCRNCKRNYASVISISVSRGIGE